MPKRGKISWGIGLMVVASFSCLASEPTIKVTAIPKRNEAKRKIERATVAVGEIEGIYKIFVKNSGFTPTPELTVQYRIFVRRDDGKKNPREVKPERVNGEAAVAAIKPGATGTVETAAVKLHRSSLDPRYYYANNARSATSDEMIGCWLRVYQGDKLLAEYLSSSTLAKTGPF